MNMSSESEFNKGCTEYKQKWICEQTRTQKKLREYVLKYKKEIDDGKFIAEVAEQVKEMMAHKYGTCGAESLVSNTDRFDRDRRTGVAYLAKCDSIRTRKDIVTTVHIEDRPGERTYKNHHWYVRYPGLDIEARIKEVTVLKKGILDLVKELNDIRNSDEYTMEFIDYKNFASMLSNGAFKLYRLDVKQISTCMYDNMGYVLLNRKEDTKIEAYMILRRKQLASRYIKYDTVESVVLKCLNNEVAGKGGEVVKVECGGIDAKCKLPEEWEINKLINEYNSEETAKHNENIEDDESDTTE